MPKKKTSSLDQFPFLLPFQRLELMAKWQKEHPRRKPPSPTSVNRWFYEAGKQALRDQRRRRRKGAR